MTNNILRVISFQQIQIQYYLTKIKKKILLPQT